VTSESLMELSGVDSPSLAGSALRTAPATAAPQIQTQAQMQTQTGPPPFASDPQTIMTARGPVPKRPLSKTPARPEPVGLFGSLWSSASVLFGRRIGSPASVNLRSRGPTPPPRVTAAGKSPAPAEPRRPRLLLIERRRAMADTVLPELRKRGIDAEVVERWIDAIDEMFRFMPDALLVDIEIPEYERLLESLTGPSSALPVFLTGRNRPSAGQVERIPNAGFLTRPYDADELERAAQQFSHRSRAGVRRIAVPLPTLEPDEPGEGDLAPIPVAEDAGRTEPARPSIPIPSAEPRQFPSTDRHEAPPVAVADAADYIVECFNCGGIYDAMEAEWCSCLTRERSLVCPNCLTCFCKAPPAYKEMFWLEAPARLFERKTSELKRQPQSPAPNPSPDYVTRPLVLLVEDDMELQLIVQRVTARLGYGFVAAANGQDGLSLARLYKPDLILSDAFMPKLDGREMCRILRDEPGFEQCHMVVMTGLYTDTKYKSEALRRFKVDEYLAKPVAINDLVALLQRYLDGHDVKIATQPLPPPEVAKAQPQVTINDLDEWPEESIALSEPMADSEQNADEVGFEVLESTAPPFQLPELRLEMESTESLPEPEAAPEQTTYEVCCFSCAELFDAAHAEWCTCLGRDQTLVCPECGNCFCKAPSLYKERFWMDAPSILFERKTLAARRSHASNENLSPDDVKRPLILLVEDDENIQLIVRTVVTTLGYGFVVAGDGQEGLALARKYKPELVLSDAFMPKLDGREICRLLKADPATAHAKAIVMTGLYTDRKSRNEVFDYINVDDYVAKPLAVGDLLQLLRKHLPAEVQPTM
jgi:two-component system, OmpR family, alkaline phosphatase synthesis response regulator PhoP